MAQSTIKDTNTMSNPDAMDVDMPVIANEPTSTQASAEVKDQSKPVRGTTVRISVPLDSNVTSSISASRQTAMVHGTRKLLRRDSLERREAALKGKEGSRARRRWENDRLLNNPHAEPPLPQDWEIRPTYPRRTIPYYLAPLWDAAEFQRAIESKLNSSRRRNRGRGRGRTRTNSTNANAADDDIHRFNVGISPMEETAAAVPKEIRARLKHARSAKGLLQDLEEDVRGFVKGWNERELKLREDGLGDAPLPRMKTESLAVRPKSGTPQNKTKQAGYEEDEEDEEIVFVGRNGAMHDMPPSPSTLAHRSKATTLEDESDADGEKVEPPSPTPKSTSIIATEKLVFHALESDKGAGFVRWLVHCVGNYYGLRTWSVTREVEGQLRREAYVGVDSRARGLMGMGRCIDLDGKREIELPQPLWGMV